MISVDETRAFAAKHFPKAPEELAQYLGVEVRESPMSGCDGWVLSFGGRHIIRLNSNLAATRNRFTLAHELGHLILGIPIVLGESYDDMIRSDSDEERRVNELASELLLPSPVVKTALYELPVTAADLQKLARRANVSDLATAIRVCNIAEEIGLVNALVVMFDENEEVQWKWSKSLSISNAEAVELLGKARATMPIAFRRERPDKRIIVASIIENPHFGTATLFVQLLPPELGLCDSPSERRKSLELELFAADPELQPRVAGLMGFHKARSVGLSHAEAVALFWERNSEKLKNTSIDSAKGREYVDLRIHELLGG